MILKIYDVLGDEEGILKLFVKEPDSHFSFEKFERIKDKSLLEKAVESLVACNREELDECGLPFSKYIEHSSKLGLEHKFMELVDIHLTPENERNDIALDIVESLRENTIARISYI